MKVNANGQLGPNEEGRWVCTQELRRDTCLRATPSQEWIEDHSIFNRGDIGFKGNLFERCKWLQMIWDDLGFDDERLADLLQHAKEVLGCNLAVVKK